MSAFDPAAATAVYLNAIPATARHTADVVALMSHRHDAIGLALIVGVSWLVLRLNLLGGLRARIEAGRPRPWLSLAACALVFGVILAAVSAVWSGYSAWAIAEEVYRPAPPLFGGMLGAFVATAPVLVAAVICLPILYALMRRLPWLWWMLGSMAAATFFFATVWWPADAAPGPTTLAQAPPGPAREAVASLIRETRLPADGVYISNDPGLDADVTGSARHARVTITRGMWAKASPAEIRASVGHVMGHHAHRDMFAFAEVLTALATLSFLTAHALFRPVAWLMGARRGMARRDPEGLPVMAVIAVGCFALSTIAANGFIREINVRADQYSLDHAREPDGLAQSLVRAWHDDMVDPGPIQETLFFDHPSLAHRVRHAMDWKASHVKPPPV